MKAPDWVGPDSIRVDEEEDNFISIDESDDGKPGEKKTSKEIKGKSTIITRSSTRKQDAGSTVEELQAGTEQLSIEGQSHPYSSLEWQQGSISISFDGSKGKWYYSARRKKVWKHT
ncbi:hypothetical protein BDV25DRAFT_140051 [Aspergillus avenaceus]|uniref:Uncharacterized protein n=1 Tax=Aspergillus avenaceus TaxID=36643 RepID=A0A5N6TV19_ASPAV|nr:hypothetical protein BDV25DRAFT_140051 [Aspergillus avenaceus]